MGKLGAKTRQYDKNNEFKPRNYSEDGLKIKLEDKHGGEDIVFGIDAVIDVLLVKILSYGDCYTANDLTQAVSFIKCVFLSYTDPNLDMDYILAQIVSCKNTDFQAPKIHKVFDATKDQDPIS